MLNDLSNGIMLNFIQRLFSVDGKNWKRICRIIENIISDNKEPCMITPRIIGYLSFIPFNAERIIRLLMKHHIQISNSIVSYRQEIETINNNRCLDLLQSYSINLGRFNAHVHLMKGIINHNQVRLQTIVVKVDMIKKVKKLRSQRRHLVRLILGRVIYSPILHSFLNL